jgi:hypothetical protein
LLAVNTSPSSISTSPIDFFSSPITYFSTHQNNTPDTTSFSSTAPVEHSSLISATSTINPSSLFSGNNTGTQLNSILTAYTGDLSACLGNCSNQGVCSLNSLQKYVCECNQLRTGASCQTDLRPCSSNPCLNNGTCSNIKNDTSFECICQNPKLFYGIYCENKMDLCLNNTNVCTKGQGFCIVNDTQSMCKCLKDFSGLKCEIMSSSLLVTKTIINASSIIAIVVLISFVILVVFFDFTKYFLKNRRSIQKNQQTQMKTQLKRFHYYS